MFAWPWDSASVADSAIRASYIHAVKRWGRGWSAGAGEGEWGCGVWEVLIHTRTRGGGQYATHEIEGKPASCVFTVPQTCNFGSCDAPASASVAFFSSALHSSTFSLRARLSHSAFSIHSLPIPRAVLVQKSQATGVLPGPKESKGNFRQYPARQHACKVYEGKRDRRKNLQTRGDCGGCCRQWLCAQTARPPSLVMHEAIALG